MKREYPEDIKYATPEYYRWYRDRNKEKLRAYSRDYSKKRFVTHAEAEKARRQRYREKHPYKVRAQELLNRALASGYVTRQTCSVCNIGKAYAHHDYYGKPFEVTWFCAVHHSAHHKYLQSIGHDSSPTPEQIKVLLSPNGGMPRKIKEFCKRGHPRLPKVACKLCANERHANTKKAKNA